jgi:hypothetical protein
MTPLVPHRWASGPHRRIMVSRDHRENMFPMGDHQRAGEWFTRPAPTWKDGSDRMPLQDVTAPSGLVNPLVRATSWCVNACGRHALTCNDLAEGS